MREKFSSIFESFSNDVVNGGGNKSKKTCQSVGWQGGWLVCRSFRISSFTSHSPMEALALFNAQRDCDYNIHT